MTTATLSAESIGQTVREAFPFAVQKLPLSGPDGLRTPHYGLFRDDSGACVGVACKRGYVPHTVDDVSALAEAAAAAFDTECQVRAGWRDGHILTVAPSADFRRSIYGTADDIFPRLIVSARYDGRAFRASLGMYRDACRNLAMPAVVNGQHVTSVIRHTHGLRQQLPRLVERFGYLASRWDDLAAAMVELDRREMDVADFIRSVYPIPAQASRRTQGSYERRVSAIVGRMMRERGQVGRPAGEPGRASAWELVNAVQGYVQHDQRRNGRPGAFERAVLALDDAAVSRAWELAIAA